MVPYLFQKGNTDRLIVVFSGFSGKNVPARYNYVRTLHDNRDNELFILDDFGYLQVGSYYLGDNLELYQNNTIEKLISWIKKNKCPNVKDTVFTGSSKGGTCALYFGMKMNADCIICGSPQYHIADYLHLNEYHEQILSGIYNSEVLPDGRSRDEFLNGLGKNAIVANKGKTKVYMIYSSLEPSYHREIMDLITDLEINNTETSLSDAKYENHSDIAKYFTSYLKETLKERG